MNELKFVVWLLIILNCFQLLAIIQQWAWKPKQRKDKTESAGELEIKITAVDKVTPVLDEILPRLEHLAAVVDEIVDASQQINVSYEQVGDAMKFELHGLPKVDKVPPMPECEEPQQDKAKLDEWEKSMNAFCKATKENLSQAERELEFSSSELAHIKRRIVHQKSKVKNFKEQLAIAEERIKAGI